MISIYLHRFMIKQTVLILEEKIYICLYGPDRLYFFLSIALLAVLCISSVTEKDIQEYKKQV